MLSDEEKKAMEEMGLIIEAFYDFPNPQSIDFNCKDCNYLEIVLNLIEKQQKEIESLNLENIELKQNKIVEKNSISNQDNFYDCYNYIHNDKIKAKIEELKQKKYILSSRESEIKILQLLLEKE